MVEWPCPAKNLLETGLPFVHGDPSHLKVEIQNWTYFSVGPVLDLFESVPD